MATTQFPSGIDTFANLPTNFMSPEKVKNLLDESIARLLSNDTNRINVLSKLSKAVDLSQYSLAEYISAIHRLKTSNSANNIFQYALLCFPLSLGCHADMDKDYKPAIISKEEITKQLKAMEDKLDANYAASTLMSDIANLPACISEPVISYIPLLNKNNGGIDIVTAQQLIKKNVQQDQQPPISPDQVASFNSYKDSFGFQPSELVKILGVNNNLASVRKTIFAFSLLLFKRIITSRCLYEDYNFFQFITHDYRKPLIKVNLIPGGKRNALCRLLPGHIVTAIEYIAKATYIKNRLYDGKFSNKNLQQIKTSLTTVANDTSSYENLPTIGDSYGNEDNTDYVISILGDMTTDESPLKRSNIKDFTYIKESFFKDMWPIKDGVIELKQALEVNESDIPKRLLLQAEIVLLGLVCYYITTNTYSTILTKISGLYQIKT